MTTSTLIKRLRTKLAATERSEESINGYDLEVSERIHDLIFDLEEGRRYNDSHVATLATFLLNGLLPESLNESDRKAQADKILRKAWKLHVERFLSDVGVDINRLEDAITPLVIPNVDRLTFIPGDYDEQDLKSKIGYHY